jgi:Putative lumazine-binding
MKKIVIILFMALVSLPAKAQDARQQVERACLDYIEGFYEADTVKLLRAIQPRLYKIGFYKRTEDKDYTLSKMTLEEALYYARKDIAENRRMGKPDSPKKVEILDIMKVTAAAKVTALWGTDYLLLSKQGDNWMIEEVIWEGQ